MASNAFAPVTPGEMLKEEFLAEYGLSQSQLAKAIGISPNRITEIINNRRRITADTALRLGLYFGNSPEFGMNLQAHYDLKMAQRNLKPQDVKRIRSLRAAGHDCRAKKGLAVSATPEAHIRKRPAYGARDESGSWASRFPPLVRQPNHSAFMRIDSFW